MRHDHLSGHRLALPRPSAPRTLSETLVTKATATASRHPEAAGQGQEAGLDGCYNRAHGPRPWPFPRSSVAPRSPKSGAHGRIADGGSPKSALNGERAGQRRVTRVGATGCKTVGSADRWFEPNTCHHLRNRPASWKFSAMRAVSSLSRGVSSCRAAGRRVAVSTDV